jgi:hypothetical protein
VFALHRNKGARKGKTLDEESVLMFKLDKGVVIEVAEFRYDQPAEAKFWSWRRPRFTSARQGIVESRQCEEP